MKKIFKNPLFVPIILIVSLLGLDETLSFFGTLFLIERGFNGAQMGLILGSFYLGALLVILPAGFISDRAKASHVARLGLAAISLAFWGLHLSNNFYFTAASWALAGAGLRASSISLETLYYKFLEEKNRRKIGYLNIYKGVADGLLNFGAGILAASFFLGSVLSAMLYLSLAMFLASFFIKSNEPLHIPLRDYKAELKSPIARNFLFLTFIYYLHGGADNLALPYIWREELGFSFIQFGALVGLPIVIAYLTIQLWVIKHTENTRLIRVYAISGLIASALGHLIMSWAQNFWLIFGARMLHITGDTLFFFFLTTELAWLYSKKTIGGQFGVFTLVVMTAGMLSRIFIGAWAEIFSFQSSLYITAGLMLLAAAYVFFQKVSFTPRFREK